MPYREWGASRVSCLTHHMLGRALSQGDDEDELPWQVIAVLDYDILRQLVGGAEYHKQRVAEAMAVGARLPPSPRLPLSPPRGCPTFSPAYSRLPAPRHSPRVSTMLLHP